MACTAFREVALSEAFWVFVQFWRGDMSCLQKLVSSVFHSVRGFLDTDALKEVGTSITSSALQHFYGVDPSSLQANPGKKPTARSGRGVALETG